MKLRQVLINVLGNAVKFTPPGGRVELQVERTAKFDGKTTLRFTISDNGIGMSKEFLPHLFDAFSQEDSSTTTKYASTGLGMDITKSIVEMMNGQIEVESEKDAGTTFVVTVTLCDSDRTDLQDEQEIRPGEMTVLIVDDDPVACRMRSWSWKRPALPPNWQAPGRRRWRWSSCGTPAGSPTI